VVFGLKGGEFGEVGREGSSDGTGYENPQCAGCGIHVRRSERKEETEARKEEASELTLESSSVDTQ
jgi:hypothetical protein